MAKQIEQRSRLKRHENRFFGGFTYNSKWFGGIHVKEYLHQLKLSLKKNSLF